MAAILLILRPEPGAGATAERARMMGLEAVRAPLFEVVPVDWTAPDADAYDALLLTSANAVRSAGPQIERLRHLRGYCVGEATAEAARGAGMTEVRVGDGDAERAAEMAAAEGARRLLHLCGRDYKQVSHPKLEVTAVTVYRSDPVAVLPLEARTAAETGAVALIHSPRAGRHFGNLIDAAGISRKGLSVAAISRAALEATGEGWSVAAAASLPRDEALLSLAAKLCNMRGGKGTAA